MRQFLFARKQLLPLSTHNDQLPGQRAPHSWLTQITATDQSPHADFQAVLACTYSLVLLPDPRTLTKLFLPREPSSLFPQIKCIAREWASSVVSLHLPIYHACLRQIDLIACFMGYLD